ncbi:MAG: sigma-70 family RNA polymerase sigma factor [Oceanospirillaceae bacterium]
MKQGYEKRSGEDLKKPTTILQQEALIDWSDLLSILALKREKELYIQIYQHFAPKIKAYIIRLGMVNTTAEELMQETMLSVWHKAHLYDASKAVASTWIFRLARNKSIDWMRKQKYPDYSLQDWLEEPAENNNCGEQLITSDRMAKIIKQLPEKQGQVIYMSFYEGRSHVEIAARLGIPLGSVKSRIRLASQKIKMIWKDEV